MHHRNHIRTSTALFMAVLYAIVVLFSTALHQHSHGYFDAGSFCKDTKTVTADVKTGDDNDCISCHFLHSAKVQPVQQFTFTVFTFEPVVAQFFDAEEVFFRNHSPYRSLRGPPAGFNS